MGMAKEQNGGRMGLRLLEVCVYVSTKTTNTVGRYYYVCLKSLLTPIGCINDNGTRIAKDTSYINDGFEFRCVMDTEGYLFFEPASCVDSKGKRHQPGDTWDHETGVSWVYVLCNKSYL
jgi:hypothetical protein